MHSSQTEDIHPVQQLLLPSSSSSSEEVNSTTDNTATTRLNDDSLSMNDDGSENTFTHDMNHNNDRITSSSITPSSQQSSSPFAHHQVPLESIVSESEIHLAASVLERLSHHSYHLQDPRLAQLIHAGSLLFKRKISKEEQAEMKRESRKKAKEKFKNHDKSILMQSVMQMKKHNEVHYLRQQIAMIPNAPNSEVPKLTHEEDEVIIENIPEEGFASNISVSNEQNDKQNVTENMNNKEQTLTTFSNTSSHNSNNRLLRAVR